MLIKIMMSLAVLIIPLAQAQNNACVIRVVPSGKTPAQLAGNATQIKFPNFARYAIIKERIDDKANSSIEVVQNEITGLESAEEQANNLSTADCPVQRGLRCQVHIASPNKVTVKVRALDKKNQEQSNDAVVISGPSHSSLQDNLNLLSEHS
ncbi:MAG: hypothetical protein HYV97_05505 [Bdellovibrio sp.]|nr:hypothetical protein [Bdellovibrio sp.]